MLDINRAIQHPFEDKDWAVKILVGAGVNLVPILNFSLNGYAIHVLRNAARRQDVPLPTWDDLGNKFVDGLKLFVVQVIYILPILFLVFGLVLSSIVLSINMDNAQNAAPQWMIAGFTVAALIIACLCVLYGLCVAFLIPAMYIQIALNNTISSCFHFDQIGALIRRNLADYIIAAIAPVVLELVVGLAFGVFTVLPFVGICLVVLAIPLMMLITPYIKIILGHLYGQVARV